MIKKRNDLKSSVQWINGLEEKRRTKVLRLIGSEGIFRLEEVELEKVKVFINFIIKEFENGIDEKQIVSKLLKAGLEKETVEDLISYSEYMSLETQACRVINDIGIDKYKELLQFVLNNIHLYKGINFIPVEEFIESIGFRNDVEAKSTLRFINTYFNNVITREMTLEDVKSVFIKIHELDIQYVSLFENIIKENLDELRNAYIIFKLNKIQTFMDNIEDLLVDEEDANKDLQEANSRKEN